MYTFNGRIRYSEIDHRDQLTLPALINYFQDCSTFHSEDVGMGHKELMAKNRAWILSYWQVEITRYPKLCERVQVGTFATDFQKFLGYRNFLMKTEEGEELAKAYAVWVYMDMMKGRPVRLPKEEADAYGIEPALDMKIESRKVAVPERLEERESFPVRKHHIDTNEHVNNCQYVQMALEILPEDMKIGQLRVDYKKSAVYGDIIYPKASFEAERTVVELCDRNEKPYAVIEFKGVTSHNPANI